MWSINLTCFEVNLLLRWYGEGMYVISAPRG